jgi:hypothetical protein
VGSVPHWLINQLNNFYFDASWQLNFTSFFLWFIKENFKKKNQSKLQIMIDWVDQI